jgi:hypothetical protein
MLNISGSAGNSTRGRMPHNAHVLTVVIFINTSLLREVCSNTQRLSGDNLLLYGMRSADI